VVCSGGIAEGTVVECPRLVKMLSVLQWLAANSHDFAPVFGDVMAVFGREVSRIFRRFRWTSCRRDCNSLQMQRGMQQHSVESPGGIVEGAKRWYA
jgi:hypothetical protein